MKTTYINIKTLISILLLVCSALTYAQKAKKENVLDPLKNFPIHFPLAKEDFKNISSPFGFRRHPILQKNKLHAGIDLVAPKGAAVLASANGVVQKSMYQKGYGNHIVITHYPTLETLYAHLWITLVKEGDLVTQGQLIGFVGDTGLATGPHLHYEIHINNKKLDPILVWKSFFRTKA